MKKSITLTAMLLMCSFVFMACSNDTNNGNNEVNSSQNNNSQDENDDIHFVDERPFVKLELYSASSGTYLDHFPKHITVSNDGSVHVFTKEVVDWTGEVELKVEDDAPTIQKKISEKEVKEIKQVIEENRFLSIPEDVTDYDVMDGSGSRITVYEKGQERKVGGENSSNQRYNAIEEIIFNQVKDEYSDWVTETEEYLMKLNE